MYDKMRKLQENTISFLWKTTVGKQKTQPYIHWATGVNSLEGFIPNYQTSFSWKNDSIGIGGKGLLFFYFI